ncbi:T9SS type A sorting domain-containing protein [Polaribacter sp. Hel1_85]|uniref:T9SS type A sorting domain-containing protein n=1 Tax=Polaribacter sp. Hel1_85 TaxID=1250005 RepID=UPI00052D2B03|nr:T9SS type A sorting domain-containing protein [Polaribacter sp. Hel1_85]KGL59105.1 hypothetical protein PHEL85_3379 [Polaribacter sp. Hel1_85]
MKKQLLFNLTFLLFTIGVFAQSSGSFTGTFFSSNPSQESTYTFISAGNGTYTINLQLDDSSSLINNQAYIGAVNNYTIGGSVNNYETTCVENGETIGIILNNAQYHGADGLINYTLSYQFNPTLYSSDPEPNDNFNDSITINENTPTEGWFNNSADPNFSGEDWYSFTPTTNGTLLITLENTNSVNSTDGAGANILIDNATQQISIDNYTTNGLTETFTYNNFNQQNNTIGIQMFGGCESYRITWTIDTSTLSSENFDLNNSFKIYPNPVLDNLNFTINNNLNIEKVEIIGITGKLIKVSHLINNSISTQNLKNGIYFVKIYSDKGITTKKIIKSE